VDEANSELQANSSRAAMSRFMIPPEEMAGEF